MTFPYLTPSSTLKSYGIKASKKLGQHFLNNTETVQKIIKIALPLKDEFVLEIGPGLGIITQALLDRPIYKLICAEYDQRCIKYLQNTLSYDAKKLIILNEDALKLKEEQLVDKRHKLIIISNLPYNISTLLLLKWLKKIFLFKKIVLVLQKEVAERICAYKNTKNYSIISVLTQFLCNAKLEFEIHRSDFFPQPRVNSAVISIVPRKDLEKKFCIYKKLELLCKTVFNKRRKTLKNSIAPILKSPEQSLLNIGIDPSRRPEDLSIKEFELIVRKVEFISILN